MSEAESEITALEVFDALAKGRRPIGDSRETAQLGTVGVDACENFLELENRRTKQEKLHLAEPVERSVSLLPRKPETAAWRPAERLAERVRSRCRGGGRVNREQVKVHSLRADFLLHHVAARSRGQPVSQAGHVALDRNEGSWFRPRTGVLGRLP